MYDVVRTLGYCLSVGVMVLKISLILELLEDAYFLDACLQFLHTNSHHCITSILGYHVHSGPSEGDAIHEGQCPRKSAFEE